MSAAAAAAYSTRAPKEDGMSAAIFSTRVPREETNITFQPVGGQHSEGVKTISEIFHTILSPLYGPQNDALEKIKKGDDRNSFLLYDNTTPVGVLVFKKNPSEEFKALGVSNSIEIKSLFVNNAAKNSGKGLGSILLAKLYEELKNQDLGEEGVHVTVSETRPESIDFFKKKFFRIVCPFEKGKYQAGVTEFLLSCPHKIREQAMQSPRARPLPRGVIFEIFNAHLDSIHALVKGPQDTFISASKDCSLYLWNGEGKKTRIIYEAEPTLHNEERWVTALSNLGDRYVISGHRNGLINLWNMQGDYSRKITTPAPSISHVCNPLNTNRITCLGKGLDSNAPSVFIGYPTKFDEYNFLENRIEHTVNVHQNDWVYCLQPISPDSLLAVQGGSARIWKKDHNSWKCHDEVISEGARYYDEETKKMQRPFISSLTPLEMNQYGITLFNGAVKIVDIEKKAIVKEWKEHQGRVWYLSPLPDGRIASCGDDRTVRLYDVRSNNTQTISGFPAPVLTILNTKGRTLIAGCARDNTNSSAMIRAIDLGLV